MHGELSLELEIAVPFVNAAEVLEREVFGMSPEQRDRKPSWLAIFTVALGSAWRLALFLV